MELSRNCEYRFWSKGYRWFNKVLDYATDFNHLHGCTRGQLTTQAFVSYKCGKCRKGKSWPNGMPPKWCPECAKEAGKCPYCKTKVEIIGHTPHLEHWLRALREKCDIHFWHKNTIVAVEKGMDIAGLDEFPAIEFNIDSGQPFTKDDYQAYCEIVGA
ncbi:MAG: hypothetical protein C0429_09600 [Sphingopyxis sp.]|nr:hypothetical protein [Sphingopyxis sp.]